MAKVYHRLYVTKKTYAKLKEIEIEMKRHNPILVDQDLVQDFLVNRTFDYYLDNTSR